MVSNRKNYIDFLKVFCCLSVIMIHVFVTARTDFPNHTQFEETLCKIIPNLLHFAVPVFFMITGYLFLTKKEHMELAMFVKKYVLKYVFGIFVFGFGFAIIEEIFNKNYSISMFLNALINTLQGKTWAHMWYLYSLVGVMLFIPLLKIILEKDSKYLNYLAIILLMSSIIIPFINIIFNIKIGFDFLITTPYLLYSIIGYYLGVSEKKINKSLCLIEMLLLSSIIAITEYLGLIYLNENNYNNIAIFGNYNSPIILLLSVLLFKMFKSIINNSNSLVMSISKHSYGIYIIHMFWINLIYKFLKFNIFGNFIFLKVLLVFLTTFTLSYITSILLKKIPYIKRIV